MSDYNVTEPTSEEIAEVFEQDKVKEKTRYFEEFEPQWADTSVGAWLDFYIQHFREHFSNVQSPQAQASKYFRASTFGRCPRRALLQRAGVDELRQPDKTAWRRFQWGDDIEWFTIRRLEALGLLVETQVAIEDDELELTCHCDAVVGGWPTSLPEIPPEGEKPEWWKFQREVRRAFREQVQPDRAPVIGLEIKSAPSYSMKRAYKHGPRGDNMMQVAAQALLAERHPEAFKIVPEAWQLLMVGKDAVGFLEFQVTDDWKQAALKRIDELREAWHEGTWIRCTCGGKHNPGLPAKEAKQRAWEIDYCAFHVGPEGSGLCCADDLEAVYRERRAGE